jgi:heterodisulfide reductase subunit A2
MNVGVYFCRCGGIVSDKINGDALRERLEATGEIAYFESVELACSGEGIELVTADLRAKRPDAVVIAACSPRDHEETFRGVMTAAGLNPFLMQMVNIREHLAWVTEDGAAATEKAFHMVRAAVRRVTHHEPLERGEIEVNSDALIIGAGPAGLKAALTLAEAGRKVVLVEKNAILGGMPVRYDEIFPALECGPCVLEPFMAEALHGPHSDHIEMFLLSEVTGAVGSFGQFTVTIRQQPRRVSLETCIGCGGCIEACPAEMPDPVNCGMSQRKAMGFTFFGGLPNVPHVEPSACLHVQGQECQACVEMCPIPGAVNLDEPERTVERTVGAILVAVGATLYDCSRVPGLGYGALPGVVTSHEFERILAGSGPTGGRIQLSDGTVPESIAIVHCVGSLEPEHNPYCSGICCMTALKFGALIEHKLHGTKITHYYRHMVVPGKEEHGLYEKALGRPGTSLVQIPSASEVSVAAGPAGGLEVSVGGSTARHDMVVLMPAVVPSESMRRMAQLLDLGLDKHGFYGEMQARVDATCSKVRGVYIAGSCQAPMDLARSMTQGLSVAGLVLSALVPGRKLPLEVVQAVVGERCSGCRSCVGVCPYKAVRFDTERGRAEVDPVLCAGCGTCVAGCPSAAIQGRHFTNEQILAEIEGVLA